MSDPKNGAHRLAELQEVIAENLSSPHREAWLKEVQAATPDDIDVGPAVDGWVVAVLTDPDHGMRGFAGEQGPAAIEAVAALYQRRIAGDKPTEAEWRAAEAAASKASTWAAVSVAWGAAEAADEDMPGISHWTARIAINAAKVRRAVARAVAEAGDAADAEAVAEAAWDAHWIWMADSLIARLLALKPEGGR